MNKHIIVIVYKTERILKKKIVDILLYIKMNDNDCYYPADIMNKRKKFTDNKCIFCNRRQSMETYTHTYKNEIENVILL